MRYLPVFLLIFAPFQEQDAEFIIKMKDGSIIKSKFSVKDLTVKTDFGEMNIPLKEIQHVWSVKDVLVVKTAKSSIECRTDQKVDLKTKHGTMKIKMDQIAEMVLPTKKIMFDDNVVGFWDLTCEGDYKLTGGEFVTEDDKPALKLDLSKGNYIELPHKEELNPKEVVTIEMKFKVKDFGSHTNYLDLLVKGESYGTGSDSYHVIFWPYNRQIQVGSYTDNGNIASNYGRIPIETKWHTMTIILDSKNSRMDAYIDAKKAPLSMNHGGFNGANMKTNDSSIFICKNNRGLKNTIFFEFIRISNKARTEEEMKEYAEQWSPSFPKKSSDNEYDSVIMTKDGEKLQCKLDSNTIDVETSFGDMKLETSKIEAIKFFEYRKEQITQLHEKAKKLVEKLGDGEPETREKAQEELKKLGWVIIPVLEENKGNEDEEIASRVKKLLESMNKKFEVKKDFITTGGMEIRGWIKGDVIKAKTRYGNININYGDIASMVFGKDLGSIVIELKDKSKLVGYLVQEEIEFKTDFAQIKIPIKDIVKIEITKDGDTVQTIKSTFKGTVTLSEFELDTKVGKIKISKEHIGFIFTNHYKKTSSSTSSSSTSDVVNELKSIKGFHHMKECD